MISVGANIPSSTSSLNVHSSMGLRVAAAASSRILDIPCKVCGDNSSGKHYNIFACDGCAGFFKRSIRKNRQYVCKAKSSGTCVVDKTHRNQCRACRLIKCQEAGMNKDAVQHERGPRNSTLRRQQQQMVQLLNEGAPKLLGSPSNSVLNLTMPTPSPPARFQSPLPFAPNTGFYGSPALSIPRMPFGFQPIPPLAITAITPKDICEAAARLLFLTVTWATSVPSLTALPLSDQFLLLEESWRELFILAAAQYLPPLDLIPLISNSTVKHDPDTMATFTREVEEFQNILAKIRQFSVDYNEFALLKAMVLFKHSLDAPSKVDKGVLKERDRIGAVHEQTQLTLTKYVSAMYPTQPLRCGKLLMLLPTLRTISSSTIEELFFRSTIGHIPIVTVICNMYRTSVLDVS